MLLVPVEIRLHVCAAMAAGPADKAGLDIGQPKIIRPGIGTDGDRVAAAVVGAVDKQPATLRQAVTSP